MLLLFYLHHTTTSSKNHNYESEICFASGFQMKPEKIRNAPSQDHNLSVSSAKRCIHKHTSALTDIAGERISRQPRWTHIRMNTSTTTLTPHSQLIQHLMYFKILIFLSSTGTTVVSEKYRRYCRLQIILKVCNL